MIHHPPDGREALVAYVIGLSVACPLQQDNPPDCPLNPLRSQALKDRYLWVKSLSDEQLKEIARHHCACIEKKEDLMFPPQQ